METPPSRRIHGRRDAIEYVQEHIRQSENEVLLALPAPVIPSLESALLQARQNGALVVLLAYGSVDTLRSETEQDITDLASVVRVWESEMGFSWFVSDQQDGLIAYNRQFTDPDAEGYAAVYSDKMIYHLAYGSFMAHPWERGVECATTDPDPLPAHFDDFRHATFQATLWLQRNEPIRIRATARPPREEGPFREVTGQVVSTRQQFLTPKLSSMFGEKTILARTEDGLETFGGLDAYLEDYETKAVTLERP